MVATMTLAMLILAEAPKGGAAAAADLKKMAGKWQVVSVEHGGQKKPAKEVKALTVEITGGKMIAREVKESKQEATFTVNPKAKPAAAIDFKILTGSDSSKEAKGIHKLDGDTLTLCIAEPDKDRPKVFAGKEKTGHTLMVLKRIKAR